MSRTAHPPPNLPPTHLRVRVWASHASFTEPAARVERSSYPMLPPSTAQGVLEAIYWHPGFDYQIIALELLKQPRSVSILKAELKDVASPATLIEKNRALRVQEVLVDVAYVIHANLAPWPGHEARHAKHLAVVHKRVRRGACYSRPYLGMREFSANFGPPDPEERPFPLSAQLGPMPLAISYDPDPHGGETVTQHLADGAKREVRCSPRPILFNAVLEAGVLIVPHAANLALTARRAR